MNASLDLLAHAFIVGIMLFLSAFFSGSETSLTAASAAKINAMAAGGRKSARYVLRLLDDREKLIGSILLGNNVVNICASSIATTLALTLFGEKGLGIVILAMTLLVLIFCEILPKTLAIGRPEAFACVIARPMQFFVFLFSPFTRLIGSFIRLLFSILPIEATNRSILSFTDELNQTVELGHTTGRVDKKVRDIIKGAIDLDSITVEEAMKHRRVIAMINRDKPNTEIFRLVLESSHTRLPVWKDNTDNIIGILHARDLFARLMDAQGDISAVDIDSILRKPYFVPLTTGLREQMEAFRHSREQFALVVDEYGILRGLVTMEDIVEEIVGDIEDEHDRPYKGVRALSDGAYHIDGQVPLRDINRLLDFDLPDDQAVTLAGLIIHEAKCIPEPGQLFSFHGYRFKIISRFRNQITAISVKKISNPADAS